MGSRKVITNGRLDFDLARKRFSTPLEHDFSLNRLGTECVDKSIDVVRPVEQRKNGLLDH